MQKEFMRREVFIRYRLIFSLTVFLTIAFLLMLSVQTSRVRRLTAEAEQAQAELHAAQGRTQELERHLAFQDTDEYVAREARRRFGYLEPGETRFVLEGTVPSQDMYE